MVHVLLEMIRMQGNRGDSRQSDAEQLAGSTAKLKTGTSYASELYDLVVNRQQ